MKTVTCPTCGKTYQFSKDQFSKTEEIVFPCLGCKHPIAVKQSPEPSDDATKPTGRNWLKKFGINTATEPETGEKLRKKIYRSLDILPPLSQVVHRAIEIMANPESGMKELSDVIETDQSMVSNILRIANSAYFGRRSNVSSIQHACTVLGHRSLRELIVMAGVSNLLSKELKGYNIKLL